MSSGRSEDSIFTYTLIKFVILTIAVLALLVFLVIWLAQAPQLAAEGQPAPSATSSREPTSEPVSVADAASSTPQPSATATASDVPPTNTPLPPSSTATQTPAPATDTPVPATSTPRPILTNTPRPTTGATEVALVTSVPIATNTSIPTATPTTIPSLTPLPTATTIPSATPGLTPTITVALAITNPQSGAAVPAGRLEIGGVAAPGTRVDVVEGAEVLATANSDASGKWSVTLPQGLPGGEHVVRAETVNAAGGPGERSDAVTVSVLEAVIPQTGGNGLPLPTILLVAGTLLALALVFILGGAVLREWERARHH